MMGITELIQLGFFEAFYNFSNIILSLIIYIFVFAGFGIQFLLMHKIQDSNLKWSFIGFLIMDAVVMEILYQLMSGWDLFALLIIYGLILSCMIGAGLAVIERKRFSMRWKK